MFELLSYPLNSTERLDNSTLTRFQEEDVVDVVDVILEVVFGPSMLCIFVLLCLVSWIIRLSKSQERLMPSSMSESVDDCPPSYEEATQSTKVEIFVVDPPSYEEALRMV